MLLPWTRSFYYFDHMTKILQLLHHVQYATLSCSCKMFCHRENLFIALSWFTASHQIYLQQTTTDFFFSFTTLCLKKITFHPIKIAKCWDMLTLLPLSPPSKSTHLLCSSLWLDLVILLHIIFLEQRAVVYFQMDCENIFIISRSPSWIISSGSHAEVFHSFFFFFF